MNKDTRKIGIKILVALAVILAAGCAVFYYFSVVKNRPLPFAECDYSKNVVSIVIEEDGMIIKGSGFVIDTDESFMYVCTNAHTLKYETIGKVTFFNGEEAAYEKEFVDEESDVAVARVSVNSLSNEVREICKNRVCLMSQNDKLIELGENGSILHMVTFDNGVVDGESLGIVKVEEWPTTLMETTIEIQPGSSGAPIFNDEGYVVGMAMAKWSVSGYEERYYAIQSSKVTKIIAKNCIFIH